MTTRYHVGTATPATADAAGVMAAFAALFAVATDIDTGGSVSAMTWTRDSATATSQAIYSSAFGPRNSRIIIAVHDAGSPPSGPTMIASADTFTAANVLIGLCDDAAGAYVNWYAAAPFAGCTFAGYYRLCAVTGFTTGSIRGIVSTKDLWLQTLAGVTASACHAGATVVGATGYQESDGYRYGLKVSGIGDMATTWRTTTTTSGGFFGKNGTANGNAHAGLYQVGGSAWQTVRVAYIRIAPSNADMVKWAAGVGAREGITIQRASSPEYTVGSWSGVSDGPLGVTGALVNAGSGALWGWVLSSATSGGGEDAIVVGQTF